MRSQVSKLARERETAKRIPRAIIFYRVVVRAIRKRLHFFLPSHLLCYSSFSINWPELPEIRKNVNFQLTKMEYRNGKCAVKFMLRWLSWWKICAVLLILQKPFKVRQWHRDEGGFRGIHFFISWLCLSNQRLQRCMSNSNSCLVPQEAVKA